MHTYDESRNLIIRRLLQASDYHEAGSYHKIDEGFEEFDYGLQRNNEPRYLSLHIALNFWDSWIDARNHLWTHYHEAEIKREEWPLLARCIVSDLQGGSQITDPKLRKWFAT